MNKRYIINLINIALKEDIGSGDITTNAIVLKSLSAEAEIIAKSGTVVAGQETAKAIFQKFDRRINYKPIINDGRCAKKGDVIAKITGPTGSIITAERVALNFLQRLCGIATLTSKFVDRISDTKIKILDTRKTTPGLRELEKHAVRMGGGFNHRLGLFDAFLIKENHIAAAGSIKKAVKKAKANNKKNIPIEIEVRNLQELNEALREGVDIVLLDNFSPKLAIKAKKIIGKISKIEISGGINLKNITKFAKARPDFISIGEITHSPKSADLSLLIRQTRA